MEQVIPEDQRQIIEGVVHEGAAVLSKQGPPDWGQRLIRYGGGMHVADAETCPLGIIFGGYAEGLRILGLYEPRVSDTHGFSYPAGLTRTPGVDNDTWLNGVYSIMHAAWLREAEQSLTPAR